MKTAERNLNALLIIILSCVLLGGFGVQFFKHEEPCPLCMLQRLGMIGVAIGALLNLRFGIRSGHYGLSLLSAFFGGFVALRQIALHVCPGSPTFGTPFWGLSLYVWSFIVFTCSVVLITVLLLAFDRLDESKFPARLNGFGYLAFILIFLAAFVNIFTTFGQCGFGPCQG